MIIEVKRGLKVVSLGIILFVSIPPLVLAAIASRPQTAAEMLFIGLAMLALTGPYLVWTTFLTKVEVQHDTITVTTPYSTRTFRIPDDIVQVVDDRRGDGRESIDLHFRKGKDRFVFIVNRFVLDVPGNRLNTLLNELRAQVQKAKASEVAANPKSDQN